MILLVSLTDSAEITCEWQGDYCNLASITPVTQPNEVITIIGKPTTYVYTSEYYINWYMIRINMKYIPTRIFYTFPKITGFVMGSSSPRTILETNSFVNCDYLTTLTFNSMRILSVPEGFAQSCTKITNLQFNGAGVDTIHKNAFKGLVNIETLYILYSRVSCLPPDLFQTVPNVKTLDLRSNRIGAVDSGLFRNLPKLISVDLRDNFINYLPTLSFAGSALYQNFAFYISGNPIYAIKPDFCTTFNSRPVFPLEDTIDISQFLCLSGDTASVVLKKSNCQNLMTLQKCYSNWTLSMSAPVNCDAPCPI